MWDKSWALSCAKVIGTEFGGSIVWHTMIPSLEWKKRLLQGPGQRGSEQQAVSCAMLFLTSKGEATSKLNWFQLTLQPDRFEMGGCWLSDAASINKLWQHCSSCWCLCYAYFSEKQRYRYMNTDLECTWKEDPSIQLWFINHYKLFSSFSFLNKKGHGMKLGCWVSGLCWIRCFWLGLLGISTGDRKEQKQGCCACIYWGGG